MKCDRKFKIISLIVILAFKLSIIFLLVDMIPKLENEEIDLIPFLLSFFCLMNRNRYSHENLYNYQEYMGL